MHIIEYFKDNQTTEWINKIEACDWVAAKYLAKLLKENSFEDTLGKNGKLYIMVDEEQIVSFITLTGKDCIDDDNLYPWLGFLYTSPEYRGRRYSEKIIEYACNEAKNSGNNTVYLATDHVGLYEKYGFIYKENRIDVWGEDSRIYFKLL